MIIEKVIINTFGGLSKKEMDFKEGMNVIIGPNESGKSTIYNAIENTLFTPSNLTPSKFRKQMGRFIPVGGGDTIEVTIHFKRNGKEYILQRRWGASVSSSLTLPDGSFLTDDDAIQDIIRECLQVPEGTCKTVMMTYQSGLSKTVDDVQDNNETLESLGDLLRKAIMEMDGVSVDTFRAKTEGSYNDFFGRWDIDANYPEHNRGIEYPWVRGVVSITTLFYEKEEVRKALDEAVSYEIDLDELNERISDHAKEVDEAESYVKNNKVIKDDAVKRRQIEADLKGLNLEYEKLEAINKDWPVTESKIKEKSKRLPELEDKEKKLHKEKEKAESYQKGKELLDQFSRVEKKKQTVDKETKSLEKVIKLTEKDLKNIREAFNRKGSLEASLSAGKLSAKFSPKKDTELEIQKGLEDKALFKTRGGKTLEFQADGRLLLSHPEWGLEVTSGEVEYDQILKDYEKAKSDIEGLLKKFNVINLEGAEAANRAYEAELAKIENAQSNLEEELGELTYEELKEKVNRLQVEKPERELTTILGEVADTKTEIKSIKEELEGFKEKLQKYIEEYADHKKLFEKVVEVAGERKEKHKALSSLKPLPAEIDNVEEFISKYEEMESRLKDLKEKHNKLIQERIRLEGRAPDRSVEEIERDLAEAEQKFNAELRKGMSIASIKESVENLLKEMDSSTYEGLEKDVAGLMQKMTAGRYKDVVMEGSIPSGFQRNDGVEMPYDYLSTGTKDVLGVALRLAITKKFLEEKEGFVIMDDPLVDLDPDRQSKTADVIKDFAEEKQLILLTCHPSHAKLLGGHQIQLN
ncbi:MAG: AAA family ATPase [Deltaproteobacteria bacterium]|nr:AAA family ATPase [Deltaproteobacteria bacterium]